jgi:hypothetical protein
MMLGQSAHGYGTGEASKGERPREPSGAPPVCLRSLVVVSSSFQARFRLVSSLRRLARPGLPQHASSSPCLIADFEQPLHDVVKAAAGLHDTEGVVQF